VTEFGEQRTIVTTAPIFTSNGLKLVEAGVRIDRGLYDRLVQHRLSRPIDDHLSVERAVNAASLRESALALIDERPFCTRIADAAGGADTLLAPLGGVPLPTPIAFKLTLMQETQPELFAHSLQMMLVALLLGLKAGRRARALVDLAAAGLLHDLGVLHIDPDMLKPGHRMTPEERQHLFAHPLTTSLILKEHPEYSADVIRAVMEHHERLDGSGYPRALHEHELSEDGKILMLAEVVSGVFEKNRDAPGLRLSLILRLNHRKFDKIHVNALAVLLRDENRELAQAPPLQQEIVRIEALGSLLTDWIARLNTPREQVSHPAENYLAPRLREIQRSMLEAGLDPALLRFIIEDPEREPETLSELALLAREALWQIDRLAHDVVRRWPAISDENAPDVAAFLQQLEVTATDPDVRAL
jgi:HD-GYP domain-containing protein (c-di-GMP phosphodiesterase class II)